MKRRSLIWAAALAAVVIVGGGGVAGICKAAVNCRALVGLPSGGGGPPPVVAKGGPVFEGGFVAQPVVRGLRQPTDFAFLPDGRILIAEKIGVIRLVDHGRLLRRPVLDLRASTSTGNLRGIMTVQVDPDFPRMPYVYVLRTLKVMPTKAPTSARLSRFTLNGSVADPRSEVVLAGSVPGGRSCLDLPPTADCLPDDSEHVGAQIHFSGGLLYVSTGDGGGERPDGFDQISRRVQNIDSLGGKILRITRAGAGVPTNPYWNGDPHANRSKVWASGLRNPFRWTFRPGTSDLYVADVGANRFDEISVFGKGANLGWPCYEGTVRFEPYEDASLCTDLYGEGRSAVRFPVLEFGPKESRSLVGGAFYTGKAYPRRYAGAYFFAGFVYGWMKLVRFDSSGRPLGPVESFGSGLDGPVAIHNGPDGRLYYLSYVDGELRRIDYPG